MNSKPLLEFLDVFFDWHKNNPNVIVDFDYAKFLGRIGLTNPKAYIKLASYRIELPFQMNNIFLTKLCHIFCARWIYFYFADVDGGMKSIANIFATMSYFTNRPVKMVSGRSDFVDHPFWDPYFASKVKRLEITCNCDPKTFLMQLPSGLQELAIRCPASNVLACQLHQFHNIVKFISSAPIGPEMTYPPYLTYLKADTCHITVKNQLPKTLSTLIIDHVKVNIDVIDDQQMPPMDKVALGYGDNDFVKNFCKIRKFVDHNHSGWFFQKILEYSVDVDIVEVPNLPKISQQISCAVSTLYLACNIDYDDVFQKRYKINSDCYTVSAFFNGNFHFTKLTIVKIHYSGSFYGCNLTHTPLKKFALYGYRYCCQNLATSLINLPPLEKMFIHFHYTDKIHNGPHTILWHALNAVSGTAYLNIQTNNEIYDHLAKNPNIVPTFKNLYAKAFGIDTINGVTILQPPADIKQFFIEF
jgi:hypothetical protein